MTQWFANHHFPLSKLRAMTLRELGKPLELVKAAATRFGSHTLVGARRAQMIGYADGIDVVEQDAEAMSLNQ